MARTAYTMAPAAADYSYPSTLEEFEFNGDQLLKIPLHLNDRLCLYPYVRSTTFLLSYPSLTDPSHPNH